MSFFQNVMEKIKINKVWRYGLAVKKWIKNNRREAIVLGIILLIGAFLRLYKIDQYMTFLGDEGRDAIIVRRLLVDADLILIGPGTSIGNMYLGPLYYYMMAPALLLAGFSPAGPAVMIALLGVITIAFVWWAGREWFSSIAGLMAAGLYAVSPTVIIFSRSSWNPNIMPFFALLAIYSIWKVWEKEQYKWLIVSAISFTFVLQSHYLGLVLGPVIGLFWLLTFLKIRNSKPKIRNFLRNTLIAGIIFAGLMSPLVIFDARHGWNNFTAMKKFFIERQTTVSARPWTALPKAWPIFEQITARLLTGRNEEVAKWVALIILFGTFWLFTKIKKGRREFYLILVWLALAVVGLGVYKQHIYDHYYGFFFPAPFLLIGLIADNLYKGRKLVSKLLVVVGFAVLVIVNLQNCPLLDTPNRQLARTEEVAEKIQKEAGGEKFNLAVLAERNYEGAYQYFLEAWNVPIVMIDPQRADETITNQLFVVCELSKEKCKPTTDPKAEIANFGWSKIEEEWEVSGVILYKLAHAR